jgi:DNA polymerase III alpha subunit
MFATLEDESGLLDFVMFPGVQRQWAKAVLTNEVLAIEGRLKREGEKGLSISIVAERVLQCFSGPFPLLVKKFQSLPNQVSA